MTHEPRKTALATVVTGDLSTEYLCQGSGRPLLLLANAERREPLMHAGGATFRVIAPILGPGNGFDPSRVVDLLDGLGLWDVRIVADREFEDLAFACAGEFPDRVLSVLIDDESIDLPGALARLAG